ncbi:MAG: A/G-specific adenine glycosylase, partial [Thiomonas sp.]
MPDNPRTHVPASTEQGPRRFSARLVQWQRQHGRHDLPWKVRDPYRVWLSEIMLQQTQVAVVTDYFARFTARFPTVQALAAAPQDAVLAAWSGLGYYQRARNLHHCAQIVVETHGGAFPQTAEMLATLPGVGPSTAAAIAAFCFDERAAILDGNVQRVLCRSHGIDDPVPTTATTRKLWALARLLLPEAKDIAAYTQALMDLGATVCKPRQPLCMQCPFQTDCRAHRSGDPQRL